MVSINYSSREVCCKIVYYGPGLSGKTTNLQYVHSKVPGNTRGELISLATEADRTLYFDFLPINIGTINGFAAKFQLYTVPGQVYYNATRKLINSTRISSRCLISRRISRNTVTTWTNCP